LALAALFWSGNFIAGRALRGQIDPLMLNFARWSVALVLLAPFAWRDAFRNAGAVRREWRLILGLGASGIAAFHTLVYFALQTTTATNALLLFSLTPVVILVGAILLGMESATHRQLAGATVSITGAVVLITRGDLNLIRDAGFAAGDLWMLLAVAIWSLYSLLLRRRPADLPQNVTLAASIAAALLLLVPFLALFSATELAVFVSVPILLSVGYIALFASVLAFLVWSYGVSKLGASRSGQFIHLMPVFGAVLAGTLLGETLALSQIVGAILVLSGITLFELRPGTRTGSQQG
jgi:drug/metabolite transporter (DMT)-like permease